MQCIELLSSSIETMGIRRSFVLLLFVSIAWSHRHHGYYSEHRREEDRADVVEQTSSFGKITDTVRSELLEENETYPEAIDSKASVPFSARRLEKMLEKAILQIITGDLSKADMLLLKSLNYSLEEVLMIRERELGKREDEESRKVEEPKSNGRRSYDGELYGKKEKYRNRNSMEVDASFRDTLGIQESRGAKRKNRYKGRSSYDKDFDFEAYNRQATIDYENLASKLEPQQSWSEFVNLDYEDESKNLEEQDSSRSSHRNFDRAMEPHVVFKIRYDDSEFDSNSGSEERSKLINGDGVTSKDLGDPIPSTLKDTVAKNVAGNFIRAPSLSSSSSSSSTPPLPTVSSTIAHTPLPPVYQLGTFNTPKTDHFKEQSYSSTVESPESSSSTPTTNITSNVTPGVFTELNNSTDDENSSDKNAIRKKLSEYEGLEWIEDDVYRVIPKFVDSLGYDNMEENEMLPDYEDQNLGAVAEGNDNDTVEYQNETPDPPRSPLDSINGSIENPPMTNLSTYQQLVLEHRRE